MAWTSQHAVISTQVHARKDEDENDLVRDEKNKKIVARKQEVTSLTSISEIEFLGVKHLKIKKIKPGLLAD